MEKCITDVCEGQQETGELCMKCFYAKTKKHEIIRGVVCLVNGCDKIGITKGLCQRHYVHYNKYSKIMSFEKKTKFDKNEIVIKIPFAEIILTDNNGYKNGIARIDASKVRDVKKHKWCLTKKGYAETSIKGKKLFLHRFLFFGYDKSDSIIDHITRDRLDNRMCNLRKVDDEKNSKNRSLRSDSTSGFIGVAWWKSEKKWLATISVNKKQKKIGIYDCKSEALRARLLEEEKIYGEYGYQWKDNNIRKYAGLPPI